MRKFMSSGMSSVGGHGSSNREGVIGFDEPVNVDQNFANNKICTSRYKIYNFFFLNLREQFRRVANIYFLIISILMLLGWYFPALFQSSINPWGTVLTLIVVLGITMLKDGIEDKARHKADRIENASPVRVLRRNKETHGLEQVVVEKEDVCVGDYVLVQNKEQFPADLILVAASDERGQGYVETANIDGETSLKIRRVPKQLLEFNAVEKLNVTGSFECDVPNKDIHNFSAVLEVAGEKVPCGPANFLLRGSMLRNTTWIVGLVVYTGEETKIMMNRSGTPAKLSKIERTVNKLILIVFLAQFTLVVISVILNVAFSRSSAFQFLVASCDGSSEGCSLSVTDPDAFILPYWLGNFFTFYILYSNFVPISLYVTIEMVNLVQAVFIEMDPEMYHDEEDVAAKCRNSTLCQELGQIEYIFSDKTGTLTCNMMEFQRCSIGGKVYDLKSSTKAVAKNNEKVKEFFRLLALCHTVVPDHEVPSVMLGGVPCPVYEAESPDEGALVEAAAAAGIRFWDRTPDTVTIQTGTNTTKSYQMLAVNEFNSTRKRMSILFRDPSNKYILYCKGADSVMFERLKGKAGEAVNQHLTEFAQEGLRTLVCAKRVLSEKEALDWLEAFKQAELNVENRAKALADVAEEIEQNMTIVGASAIEDRLQDEVPETIEDLQLAGVKVWVLTGDKLETAVNIGYSCRLLNKTMRVVTIAAESKRQAALELLKLENVLTISQDRSLLRRFRNRVGNMMKRVIPSTFKSMSKDEQTRREGESTENASIIARNIVKESREERQRAQHSKSHAQNSKIARSASDCDVEMVDLDMSSGNTLDSIEEGAVDISLTELSLSDIRDTDMENDIGDDNSDFMNSTDHLALVIDGKTLTFIMSDDKLRKALLHVGRVCKAVIACRVSPAQKAEIVKMVKDGVKSKPITLAIGDGANDVSMIQSAHVGIGISGREGRQAVNSSDFAIGQFRFLKKLMLVHGRWNDRRMSKVILLCFYKNICLVFTLFIFSFWTMMSGTSLYDSWIYSGFNWFSGMPPLLLGIFDQDLSASFLMMVPLMYKSGRESLYLNHVEILQWILRAGAHAIICAMVPITIGLHFGLPDGITFLYSFGLMVFAAVLFTTITIIGFETATFNGFHAFFYPGSLLLFVVSALVLSAFPAYLTFYGSAIQVFSTAMFWTLAVVWVPISCYVLEMLCKWVYKDTFPTIIQLGCEIDNGKSSVGIKEFQEYLDIYYYRTTVDPQDIDDVMETTYSKMDSKKTLSTRVARTASSVILHAEN